MAIKINFDSTHNAQSPTYLLSTKSGRRIGKLPAYNIIFHDALNSYSEIAFRVNKADCTEKFWNQIKDFKLLFCPEYNRWFEIYVKVDESDYLVKNISAKSLGEAELSQINLYGIEINTEDDISRDDYKTTVLYDKNDPKASMLNRIMAKSPHYSIDHVDASIASLQRTFSFDGTSIYDAFQQISQELNCLFDIRVTTANDGNIHRSISVYDLESYCVECGNRDDFLNVCPKCGSKNILPGYGKDTSIFVSTHSLANNIQYSTNVDSVKNCFRLVAGDDLMTATIANCNPNGSGYIWYIPDYSKDDMSENLVQKLDQYDTQHAYYQYEHKVSIPTNLLAQYNTLIDKYNKYSLNLNKIPADIVGYSNLMNAYYNTIDFNLFLDSELMPKVEMQDTTASIEISKLNVTNLSPVSVQDIKKVSVATATSAVLAMAKVVVDPRYQVKVKESFLSGSTWSGTFIVTNYSDEEDTATGSQIDIEINDNYEEFVKQKIDKALNKVSDNKTDICGLFKLEENAFESELKKYSLARLVSFHDACQTCLDILIEQGIADKETWADKTPNLYETIYLSYFNRLSILNIEISIRESEIAVVSGLFNKDGELISDGLQTIIGRERNNIQNALNFETFLGENLWQEFSAYRREDTYQNDNYISDGLDNAELFKRALEFIKIANKDIYKSATLQHSISASLKNLLVMKEFSSIINNFEVGNWIRIRVDDSIYKLRILEYEIDYENLENISIVFSDVKSVVSGIGDVENILNQASSMSTSYESISRQAEKGNKSNEQLENWVNKGLALTKMKIVDSADNQNITFDSHGLLCREYIPMTSLYDEKQLKVINRGLYLTNDNWRTSRAGIGNFTFYNPMTEKMEESYGVIADTLVGNLVLSEKVGVYNKDNSIVLGENGFVVTTNKKISDTTNRLLFIIQKNTVDSEGHAVNQKLMYIDDNGNLVLNGSIKINSSTNEHIGSLDDLSDDKRIDGLVNNANKPIYNQLSALSVNLDGIRASVSTIQSNLDNSINGVNGDIKELAKKVEATMSSEDIKIEISQQLKNDIHSITTTTGFTFNENGLIVSKTGQEMTTQITENGMTITQNKSKVLVANNVGVDAKNLHATTYLIVGNNSRFEDRGNKRTGCFYIGE